MPNYKEKTPHEIDNSGQINIKLDHISQALEDVMEQLKRHDQTLYGDDKVFGLSQRVQIMWRVQTWILHAMWAGIGSIITAVILSHWKK